MNHGALIVEILDFFRVSTLHTIAEIVGALESDEPEAAILALWDESDAQPRMPLGAPASQLLPDDHDQALNILRQAWALLEQLASSLGVERVEWPGPGDIAAELAQADLDLPQLGEGGADLLALQRTFASLGEIWAVLEQLRPHAELLVESESIDAVGGADAPWLAVIGELSFHVYEHGMMLALRERWSGVYVWMRTLGFIQEQTEHYLLPSWDTEGWESFGAQIGGFFERVFGWGELVSEDDAHGTSRTFFFLPTLIMWLLTQKVGALRKLFDGVIDVSYGWDPVFLDAANQSFAERISTRLVTVKIPSLAAAVERWSATPPEAPAVEIDGGLSLGMGWVPRDHMPDEGVGFAVSLITGMTQLDTGDIELGEGWTLNMGWAIDGVAEDASLGAGASFAIDAIIGEGGCVAGSVNGGVTLSLQRTPGVAGAEPLRWGPESGTHIDFGELGFEIDLDIRQNQLELGFRAQMRDASFVLSAGDGDGFLAELLDDAEIEVDFSLLAGWDTRQGFFVDGSVGTQIDLPIRRSLGPITFDAVHLSLAVLREAEGEWAAALRAGASVTAEAAGVLFSLQNTGLELSLSRPPEGGDIGGFDLDFEFKPPAGGAFSIDTGVVTGTGALVFDPDRGSYGAVAQLEFAEVRILAAGILETRFPDGSEGFSLGLVLSAEFEGGIPLGLGFTLNGVGGMLGIQRSVNVELLRSHVRSGRIDALMFPSDVDEPLATLDLLQDAFPARRGQFVFGPMVRLSWGDIVDIDLGLLVELPNPVRLILLGRLLSILPNEEVDLVRIELLLLGVIDFDARELSIDASLINSYAGPFTLEGDALIRASWGDEPHFILSIGGFHPAYAAPIALPELRRLRISTGGDDFRMSLEAYLAITSNSLQVGAELEMWFRWWKFSIEGELGFNALFIWEDDRFWFTTDVRAALGLFWDGDPFLAAWLEGRLSGPGPWHIEGSAGVVIFGLELSVDVEHSFGERKGAALPPPADLFELVATEISGPAAWSADSVDRSLVLRSTSTEEEGLRVHPLAKVELRQRVAPLENTLDRYGNARLSGPKQLRLDNPRVGGHRIASASIEEAFAPAQYFDLEVAERLELPSFQRLPAGLRIEPPEPLLGPSESVEVGFEELPEHEPGPPRAALAKHLRYAASSRAASRHSGRLRYAAKPVDVQLDEPSYQVITPDQRGGGFTILDLDFGALAEFIHNQPRKHRIVHFVSSEG